MEYLHAAMFNTSNNTNNNKYLLPPQFSKDTFTYDYLYHSNNLSQVSVAWQDDTAFLPLCVLYSCAFIAGTLGNLFVILSHVINKKRKSSTSSFLVVLAVSDILFLLVCTPHDLITRMERDIAGGKLLCKTSWFIEMVTTAGSVFSLVAVSVERYVVIVHPMRSRLWCRSSRISKVMVALWCVAVVISIPILYLQNTRRSVYYNAYDYVVVVQCGDFNGTATLRKFFIWFQLVIIFIFPVLSMFFCYAVVIKVLWRSTKQLNQLTEIRGTDKSESRISEVQGHQNVTQSVTSESDLTHFGDGRLDGKKRTTTMMMKPYGKNVIRRSAVKNYGDLKESRKQVIKMLIVIIIIFFIFIGPKWYWNLLKRYRIEFMTSDEGFILGIIVNFLPFLHTCANPVILAFLSSSFRVGLKIAFSQLNSKLHNCFGRLCYYLFCCCCCHSGGSDKGVGRCCSRSSRGGRMMLRRELNEPCSETMSNYNTGLREAWVNQDETTMTSVATKQRRLSERYPQPDTNRDCIAK